MIIPKKAFSSLGIHGGRQELSVISCPLTLSEHCLLHVQTHRQNNKCGSCIRECENLGMFCEPMGIKNISAKVPQNHPHPCSQTHPTQVFSAGKTREMKGIEVNLVGKKQVHSHLQSLLNTMLLVPVLRLPNSNSKYPEQGAGTHWPL